MQNIVATLCDLVRIPSVNPMGSDASGPEFLEHAITERLERIFSQLGLHSEQQPLEPQRANIIARLDGNPPPEEGGRIIMLEAHQDTVPVDGMTIPPWTPKVRDGRVYGRGACDVKGGMACMLTALSRLAGEPSENRPTVIMACTANEEYGHTGADALVDFWTSGSSRLLPRAPDAIVVAEPTLLDIVVAHKGVLRWKCHTTGRACHSSQPQLGNNAVYDMARVVSVLEQYAEDHVPRIGRHPLVGSPTLSVGVISGGISVNTVPDCCTIQIDRRLLPDENSQSALDHVVKHLAENAATYRPVEHDEPLIDSGGLSDEANGELADLLSGVARRCGAAGERIGVPYGTNASSYSSTGVPTVVFGPGSIQQAHTADEWVAVEQLERATEILFQFLRESSTAETPG